MIKKIKYILIICPIILTILLGVNIYKYNKANNNNQNIIEKNNNLELKIKENNTKKEELIKELAILKEDKKDKIWEYERWIKWNKEIIDMIN